jgi:hypothetical protein
VRGVRSSAMRCILQPTRLHIATARSATHERARRVRVRHWIRTRRSSLAGEPARRHVNPCYELDRCHVPRRQPRNEVRKLLPKGSGPACSNAPRSY